MNMITVTGSLN